MSEEDTIRAAIAEQLNGALGQRRELLRMGMSAEQVRVHIMLVVDPPRSTQPNRIQPTDIAVARKPQQHA